MRAQIASTPFLLENTAFNVTVSIGVTLSVNSQTNLTELLKQADDALYSSKNGGRNRVTLWNESQIESHLKKAS